MSGSLSPTMSVSSQAELNADIVALDEASSGSYTIDLTGDITESGSDPAGIYAIQVASGVTVTIDGNGHSLNGGGTEGGLAVIGGKVSIADLTIEDTVAQGGDGQDAGGGGAGLGGGLFVGPTASVSISDVTFTQDAAKGGAGGSGAGGGAGGKASLLVPNLGGDGTAGASGSPGAQGTPGLPGPTLGTVQGTGTAGGDGGPGDPGKAGDQGGYGGDGGAGGSGGDGGRGGQGGNDLGFYATNGMGYVGGKGGHGGNGGSAAPGGAGGDGGIGGDGGAGGVGGQGGPGGYGGFGDPLYAGGVEGTGGNAGPAGSGGHGGDGGFGGGGGSGGVGGAGGPAGAGGQGTTGMTRGPGGVGSPGGKGGTGGVGGYGGGGGGGGGGGQGGSFTGGGDRGPDGMGEPGGFGGGYGASGGAGAGGGGGLGAGGDIFIAQGGVLTVDGGLLTGGAVAGGAAGPGAQDGGAHGAGIFLQGSETITLAAASGQTLTIDDPIADQTGSGGVGATAGTGAIAIAGTGTVTLAAADSFRGGIRIESGTLDLAAPGAAGSGAISFAAQPAMLSFAAADAPVVDVNDFATGDTIAVTGFVATGHSYAGGDLTLDGAGGPVVLALPGLTGSNLSVIAGSDDTTILSGAVPCFCAGTKLRTDTGEVAVEHLAVGDRVATLSGAARPIIWIGHRRVDCRRHPNPEQVLPVRVARHAFGMDRPRCDLLLSPDHAVLVQAVLIPIKCLINGRSIAQVTVDAVTYYHVELPEHDVLWAEGLPTESYLDSGDRSNFGNGGEVMRLFPDFGGPALDPALVWEARGYAPLVVCGPELEAARGVVDTGASSTASAA